MKIAVHDNAGRKFSQMIIDHWQQKGHEVFFEMGANPKLAAECDLTYIDFLDQNFYCLFNGLKGDHNPSYPKKRVAVRAIDIDVWMGRHRDPIIWTYMDDLITICDYHYNKIENEGHPPKGMHHLIRPGVDLEKFSFRKKERGYKVCMVTGDFWEMKNMLEGFRIFQLLVKRYPQHPWELHIRGQHHSRELEQVCKDHLIDSDARVKDKVTIYGPVDDMNSWYDQMDYIITPSLKEAFSYATAEAMSKGIKPILNNWLGADTIWPKKYIYNDLDEAVEMVMGEYNPEEYRQVVTERYDLKRMLSEYDTLFGT